MNKDDSTPFSSWLETLPFLKANQGPARGTIAGALVVLQRLKTDFSVDINRHVAPKATQVKGASGAAIKSILAEFGETRAYLSEGGRTNRGLRDDMEKMLTALSTMKLGALPERERLKTIAAMQQLLVLKVQAYHNRQRLKFAFEATKSTHQLIDDLLTAAREAGKEGPAAQHLVGAKLQLRYPQLEIENNRVTTADQQLGRAGDFLVGDTAFHVTVAPMPAVLDKCRRNLADGRRAYLLVPTHKLEAARQMATDGLAGRMSILALEAFVSQNIDEIGVFSAEARTADFARLIAIYNERVNAIENDKSLMIEVPRALVKFLP